MLQLIITLNDKNELESLTNSSGNWKLFFEQSGHKDRLQVKYFSQADLKDNLVEAFEALLKTNIKF